MWYLTWTSWCLSVVRGFCLCPHWCHYFLCAATNTTDKAANGWTVCVDSCGLRWSTAWRWEHEGDVVRGQGDKDSLQLAFSFSFSPNPSLWVASPIFRVVLLPLALSRSSLVGTTKEGFPCWSWILPSWHKQSQPHPLVNLTFKLYRVIAFHLESHFHVGVQTLPFKQPNTALESKVSAETRGSLFKWATIRFKKKKSGTLLPYNTTE